nr:hypothetical protein [Spirochaetota bacterium]
MKDDFFEKQLKILKNAVDSDASGDKINEISEVIFSNINKIDSETERLRKIDFVVNVFCSSRISGDRISGDRISSDKDYVEGVLKKVLSLYFNVLSGDIYEKMAIIIHKILKNKNYFQYPLVYKYILLLKKSNEETIDLFDEKFILFDYINEKIDFFKKIADYSSSYNFFFNSMMRNKIVLFLYDFFLKNKSMNIWFPFSGIALEPLVFSYIFHLILETDKKKKNIQNFNVYCSDYSFYLLEEGLKTEIYNDIFLKIKNDFCFENQINPRFLKTSLQKIKNSIVVENKDIILKNEFIDKDLDFIFINSFKLSNITFESEKISKLINRISQNYRSVIVIIEIVSEFSLKEIPIKNDNIKKVKLLCSNIYPQDNRDLHIHYFAIYLEDVKKNQSEDELSIVDFFLDRNVDPEEIKDKLKNFDDKKLVSKEDFFKYSEILTKAGFFSKSFDIIKKIYKSDYYRSDKII